MSEEAAIKRVLEAPPYVRPVNMERPPLRCEMSRKTAGHIALMSCVAAMGTLGVVAAHQLGACDHLPDPPPRSVFDSDLVTGSRDAKIFGVPDGVVGLASYAGTLGLMFAARRRAPVASKLLGVKIAADTSMAGYNFVKQIVKFGRLCSWCTGTAIATASMAYFGCKFLRD